MTHSQPASQKEGCDALGRERKVCSRRGAPPPVPLRDRAWADGPQDVKPDGQTAGGPLPPTTPGKELKTRHFEVAMQAQTGRKESQVQVQQDSDPPCRITTRTYPRCPPTVRRSRSTELTKNRLVKVGADEPVTIHDAPPG